MKSLKCTITGTSPILIHAYKGNDNPELRNQTPQEQAEFGVYRITKTQELCLPSPNLQSALINAAPYVKRGLGKVVSGCVWIEEPEIGLGTKDFDVDTRGVVVQRNRVMRHRARLNKWGGSFTIHFDENLISEKQIQSLLKNAGELIGVGDFRPQKRGPFGRFSAAVA